MIGGISFSATSITSGLDVDKPVSPRPGHQYLATDTKILYVCYAAGVWVDNSRIPSGVLSARPPNPTVGDIYFTTDSKKQYNCFIEGVWSSPDMLKSVMISGTDITLVLDTTIYYVNSTGTSYKAIHQYTVRNITGFTSVQSYYISCDFSTNLNYGTATWYIRVNGVIKLTGTFSGAGWRTIPGSIEGELREGDVIELGMAHNSADSKMFNCRNFTIKCDTPTFLHEIELV